MATKILKWTGKDSIRVRQRINGPKALIKSGQAVEVDESLANDLAESYPQFEVVGADAEDVVIQPAKTEQVESVSPTTLDLVKLNKYKVDELKDLAQKAGVLIEENDTKKIILEKFEAAIIDANTHVFLEEIANKTQEELEAIESIDDFVENYDKLIDEDVCKQELANKINEMEENTEDSQEGDE